MMLENAKYIDEKAAAIRFPLSRAWFQRQRWLGGGPPYRKLGNRVMYEIKTLDEWFTKHSLRKSTSDVSLNKENEETSS